MKEHAIQFGKWIQNNFFEPHGKPYTWKRRNDINDEFPDHNIYTTEELYNEFIFEYPDGKIDP